MPGTRLLRWIFRMDRDVSVLDDGCRKWLYLLLFLVLIATFLIVSALTHNLLDGALADFLILAFLYRISRRMPKSKGVPPPFQPPQTKP